MERRFLGLLRIGNHPGHKIHQEGGHPAIPGGFDFRDILELIVHGFSEGPFSEEHLVPKGEELIFLSLHSLVMSWEQSAKYLCNFTEKVIPTVKDL
jgi:hypothetical protein